MIVNKIKHMNFKNNLNKDSYFMDKIKIKLRIFSMNFQNVKIKQFQDIFNSKNLQTNTKKF